MFERNEMFDRTDGSNFPSLYALYSPDKDVVSSLPLQMSLYFNMWFFPFWWVSEVVMLQLR